MASCAINEVNASPKVAGEDAQKRKWVGAGGCSMTKGVKEKDPTWQTKRGHMMGTRSQI
ncbi:hypothetical protein TRAPUB_6594 [Trametes pubescens]|uniref:Uncharacterized protein n=1 Tax=Trametes pubescens TaxID=154538 RepID=A0A1M2V5J5_TRAPU|nr:hypothetical protein TRAPUB_6594 [Trametes pubescens]